MTKREKRSGLVPDILPEKELETECSDLQDVLKTFRESHCAAAERPVFYWKSLHASIMNKLEAPVSRVKFRRSLLLIPAAAAFLFCLIFFLPDRRTPVPDIAAGYDQQLLIEVERALSRDYPVALESIDILARELER